MYSMGVSNIDINSDGIVDVIQQDLNGDGRIEYLAVDANHDGIPDVTIQSNPGLVNTSATSNLSFGHSPGVTASEARLDLGAVDAFGQMMDMSGDGIFDTVGVDLDGDGTIDQFIDINDL